MIELDAVLESLDSAIDDIDCEYALNNRHNVVQEEFNLGVTIDYNQFHDAVQNLGTETGRKRWASVPRDIKNKVNEEVSKLVAEKASKSFKILFNEFFDRDPKSEDFVPAKDNESFGGKRVDFFDVKFTRVLSDSLISKARSKGASNADIDYLSTKFIVSVNSKNGKLKKLILTEREK